MSKYIEMLVKDIHSVSVATLDDNKLPVSRIIDMMYYDEKGIYFLTARGKDFYNQLINQCYIALSGTKDGKGIFLRGRIKDIQHEYLDIIFENNPYMQRIYPDNTRNILNVFCIYEAHGEYFDISSPSNVFRESFTVGSAQEKTEGGYYVSDRCRQCRICYSKCPQKCIDITVKPVVIDQSHCLHCGTCFQACPFMAIERR